VEEKEMERARKWNEEKEREKCIYKHINKRIIIRRDRWMERKRETGIEKEIVEWEREKNVSEKNI
jgi:hypothetical protein